MMLFPETTGAIFSPCKTWRYSLHRIWEPTRPLMVFVMMNPSVANEIDDDPTIRRCMGFAKRDGYGGISVKNVFALRSPYPRALLEIDDPFGPENKHHLNIAMRAARELLPEVKQAPKLVVAWGNRFGGRRLDWCYDEAVAALDGEKIHCLGTTKSGEPLHPLYLAGDTPIVPWRPSCQE